MKYITWGREMESRLIQTRKSTTLSTAFVLNYQEGIVSLSSQSLGKQTRPGEGQVGHLAWIGPFGMDVPF